MMEPTLVTFKSNDHSLSLNLMIVQNFRPVKIRVIFGAIFTKINKKIKIWQQS